MFSPYDSEYANERYRNRIMRENEPLFMLLGLFLVLILFFFFAISITTQNLVLSSLGWL